MVSLHRAYLLLIIYTINAQSDDCDNNTPGTLCVINGENAGNPIVCRANDPCQITCSGSESCQDDYIRGEDATDVTITCTGTDACRGNTRIYCGTGDCILSCLNTDTSCEDATIYNSNNRAHSFQCSGNCDSLKGDKSTYTAQPTRSPITTQPTKSPVTVAPSTSPSKYPTTSPTTPFPTNSPTTPYPSKTPTIMPTLLPSKSPTKLPTNIPSTSPTKNPTTFPTKYPSNNPSATPTSTPTQSTDMPTRAPLAADETFHPSKYPTNNPSVTPSKFPTESSSQNPTIAPTTSSTLISPTKTPTQYSVCNPISLTISHLEGLSSSDFNQNDKLQFLISNITNQAIVNAVVPRGINANSFVVKFQTATLSIVVIQKLCSFTAGGLQILLDILVEESTAIALFIQMKMTQYFKNDDAISTGRLSIGVTLYQYTGLVDITTSNVDMYIITATSPNAISVTEKTPSLIIAGSIIVAYFIFGFLALMDAKYLRQNDYFMPGCIITATFETLDTFSDLLFATFITLQYWETKNDNLLYTMIGCYLFVVVPVVFSIGQLIKEERQKWFNNDVLRIWLTNNSNILYLLSVLTGSAYTAVRLVNCGAFQMNIFNMGLNKKQRIQFNTKRVYGTVICENIPQVAIQVWYLLTFGVELLPIFSIAFALITIIITLLSLITQKTIIDSQQFVKICFDITGDEIKPALSRKMNDIKTEISVLLGIHENLIEVPQPQVVSKGLKIELYLFINNAYYNDLDHKSIINEALKNGKLVDIFKCSWQFDKPALINHVRFQDVMSEIQQKNMVIIESNEAVELTGQIQAGNKELNDHVNNVNIIRMPSYVKNPSFNETNAGYSEVDQSDVSDNNGDITLGDTVK